MCIVVINPKFSPGFVLIEPGFSPYLESGESCLVQIKSWFNLLLSALTFRYDLDLVLNNARSGLGFCLV